MNETFSNFTYEESKTGHGDRDWPEVGQGGLGVAGSGWDQRWPVIGGRDIGLEI